MKKQKGEQIAVVGLGCRYPGAESPVQLWENVLARRREFRRVPDCRLPSALYYDPDPTLPDHCYVERASVIDGFQFDWAERHIPRSAYESTDIVHWLALEVAEKALVDAGYVDSPPPRDRTGVIVGNSLTGEQMRSNSMRLRWPFVQRVLEAAAAEAGLGLAEQERLAATMESLYKSVFAPITEDTLAGGLSNTIAGRICNFFDFHGGGYTVDGACSSSLLAVCTAAECLSQGNLDVVLAGGVDVSLDPFELVGFAKAGALAKADMCVYDRGANGFLPGEGCGFVVLKRLDDAKRDGNTIYAVLNGWGISSDGKGGITAPSVSGQALALRRAYERAGYSMATISFIEGHGTGTPVGDATELRAAAAALSQESSFSPRGIGMTSLKSIIGHAKAAAGIGGFIKAAMAVNRRVLPPTAACSTPSQIFDHEGIGLYPITRGEPLPQDERIRAGVSAMGFGGINCHVTLESGPSPSDRLVAGVTEAALLASRQSSELFVLSATDADNMRQHLRALSQEVRRVSLGDLTDLASHLGPQTRPEHPLRFATVATDPDSLSDALESAERHLAEAPLDSGRTPSVLGPSPAFYLGLAAKTCRVGFMMPGQGSQQLGMGRLLIQRFAWARELSQRADGCTREYVSEPLSCLMDRPMHRLPDTATIEEWKRALVDAAQPAVCVASILYVEFLRRLGVVPVAVTGHSLGELTACFVAGAFDAETLFRLAALRGRAMSADGGARGQMASLRCSKEHAARLCVSAPGYAVVANINSPQQVVVSGDPDAIQAIVRMAATEDIACRVLPVANAFHSRYVERASEILLKEARVPDTLGHSDVRIYSSVDGCLLSADTPLRRHLSEQVVRQVNFVEALEAIAPHCDVLVEVGPGRILTGLARDTFGEAGPAATCVASRVDNEDDLNTTLARLFVAGANPRWEALYENRLVRPFRPASERVFIENPLERPLQTASGIGLAARVKTKPGKHVHVPASIPPTTAGGPAASGKSIEERLVELVAAKTGYRKESIAPTARLLDDLNLDSIKAGDVVQALAREYGVAGKIDAAKLATASLAEVARVVIEAGGAIARVELSHVHEIPVDERLVDLVAAKTGYRKESITPAARLLDDLNLDSIKASDVVQGLAREYGVAGKIDAAKLATASLAEVARAVTEAGGGAARVVQASVPTPSKVPSDWVRNFELAFVEESLTDEALLLQPGSRGFLVCEPDDLEDSEALRRALRSANLEADMLSFSDLTRAADTRHERTAFTLVLLPRPGTASGLPDERLRTAIGRLSSAVHFWAGEAADNAKGTIIFVSRSDGGFGTLETPLPEAEQWACLGLAQSLHLEEQQALVRVVDVASALDKEQAANLVVRELAGAQSFRAAGYDATGRRRVAQITLHQPSDYPRRHIEWGPDDVILVTGGAKGITARCVLEIAESVRCKLALIGTTPAEQLDEQARDNLKRLIGLGAEPRYYACDIRDGKSMQDLLRRVEEELGPISGVIHGAGVNRARRLTQVRAEDAFDEVGAKLLGAMHLFDLVQRRPVKMVAVLSSIIGAVGMPGNGWYAYSNEAVDLMLRDLARNRPDLQTISVAFSVWSDVGMGARLGSVERLAHMGIGSIPPDEGARRFADLFLKDPGCSRVVVTASVGSALDTWRPPASAPTSAMRFIDQVLLLEPGVELKCRTRLNVMKDPYLTDHTFRGNLLFPTVFGLEAMAEGVAYALGNASTEVRAIESVSLQRPIVVSPEHGTEIELHVLVAERDEQGEIRATVGIRCENDDFQKDYFSAVVVAGALQPTAETAPSLAPAIDLEPKRDLYGGLLFQGPRFQRLKRLHQLSSETVSLVVDTIAAEAVSHDSFGGTEQHTLLLDDPFIRDVSLQSLQLVAPERVWLPVSIGNIERFAASPAPGGQRIELTRKTKTDTEMTVTVSRFDAENRLIERLSDYQANAVEVKLDRPIAEQIVERRNFDRDCLRAVVARAERELGVAAPDLQLSWEPALVSADKAERRRIAQSCFHADGEIDWDRSGRPVLMRSVSSAADLSISHNGPYLLLALGRTNQGCDMESIEPRHREDWLGLIGQRNETQLDALAADGMGIDVAGTQLWSAREAGFKALRADVIDILLLKKGARTALFEVRSASSSVWIATAPIALARGPERVIAFSATRRLSDIAEEQRMRVASSEMSTETTVHMSDFAPDGPGGRTVFRMRLPVSFREASTLGRSIHFTHLVTWLGEAREMAMHEFFPEMVPEFCSGKIGAVTNWASVNIHDEAKAGDIIEIRMHVSERTISRLTARFEFDKVRPNGGRQNLASAEMAASWVRVLDHGVVEPMNFPPYVERFLTKMLPLRKMWEFVPPPPPPLGAVSTLERGKLLRASDDIAGPGDLLTKQVFSTSTVDGNLVGNVYFANYFIWQSRTLDHFLYRIMPGQLRGPSGSGEMICTSSSMEFLRETMPFDDVLVRLRARRVFECGMDLEFSFFRSSENASELKVAVGTQSVAWMQRVNGRQVPTRMPEQLLRAVQTSRQGPILTTHLGSVAAS